MHPQHHQNGLHQLPHGLQRPHTSTFMVKQAKARIDTKHAHSHFIVRVTHLHTQSPGRQADKPCLRHAQLQQRQGPGRRLEPLQQFLSILHPRGAHVAVGQNQRYQGAPPILEPILLGIGIHLGVRDFDPWPHVCACTQTSCVSALL